MSIVRRSTGSPFGEQQDSSRWNPEGNPPWIPIPIVNRRSSMKGPNNNINTSRTRDVENQLTSGKTIRFGANERSNSFNVYDPPEHIHYPRVTHDTKSELPKMVRSPTQSDLQDNNPFISISSVPSTVREGDTSSPTLTEYLEQISTTNKNETKRRNDAFSKGEYFPSGGRITKRKGTKRKTRSASFSRKKRKGTKRKGTKRKTRRLHR